MKCWLSVVLISGLFFFAPWYARGADSNPGIDYHGQVTFGGVPLPGAIVTAIQGTEHFTTTCDQQGFYSFPQLANGKWTLQVQMTGFVTVKQDVLMGPKTLAGKWDLKLVPLEKMRAAIRASAAAAPPASSATVPAKASTPSEVQQNAGRVVAQNPTTAKNASAGKADSHTELSEQTEGGLLIHGSENNGAASRFAQAASFGNNRNTNKGMYNGGIGLTYGGSALDANPFSLTGQNTPKPNFSNVRGSASIGGPLNIPHVTQTGPFFFVSYQWSRNLSASTLATQVPDAAERAGDFSQALNTQGQPVEIFNPATGLPFTNNLIPQISPQAHALLNFYPLPNFNSATRYNYEIPLVTNTGGDSLQARMNKKLKLDSLSGGFNFQKGRTLSPNLFGFTDATHSSGMSTNINWWHRLSRRFFLSTSYQFSRSTMLATPYWEDRANVSGEAGIAGNDQEPVNWGPPTLGFSSGIAGLSDLRSSFSRSRTSAASSSVVWNHHAHNVTAGGDFRRQEWNYLSQHNPRGGFTFTGVATQGTVDGATVGGSDFADFLLGIPDASSIAFGNADKYFRESVYDAYLNDDWRFRPELTLNLGVRWEYGAPVTEIYNRLVNLDVAPGFTAVAPVLASAPLGSLTGEHYPTSLVRPDKHGIEPRLGLAWRPLASTLVVRAGYGIYYDTSGYQRLAVQMDQQAPLSKSWSVQNSAACPLTLANGFNGCSTTTPDTFALDPNFRVGYAQNWQVSVQHDLPASMQMTAAYLGIKGTRGQQEFLPNTYAPGATSPCPACPVGFAYLTSNGNSNREAGLIQVRRRLRSGMTASVRYTYSKSVDDDSAVGGLGAVAPNQSFSATQGSTAGLAGLTIAQNWLDLDAERGPSNFDQRHLLNIQGQYTSGMGKGGGTLMGGKKGKLLKEWTVSSQLTMGSGLPETANYVSPIPGTGVIGPLRPESTGAPVYAGQAGLFLNPAAFAAPSPGQWGNVGRDSIFGPALFGLNTGLGRTLRWDRLNLDFQIESNNVLNHVTYTRWDTTVNSTQFGLPVSANAMRSLQASLRVRF